MKFYKLILTILAAVTLTGCVTPQISEETPSNLETSEPTVSQVYHTEPTAVPETQATEPTWVDSTEGGKTSDTPAQNPPATGTPPAEKQDTAPSVTQPPREPAATQPPVTSPPATTPPEQESAETEPPKTEPPVTELLETQPPATQPPATEPPATESPSTEPPAEEPQVTYEYKRQVASYAAQYINQYRGSPCTVLSGMSQVAQYRASQLTWNFSHSTADKRAALAYYEYGRYIDATEFGDDASNSYWEADSAEAICAGFKGADAQTMGKYIADMVYNSASHWSYVGSSEYSYIGVGVEYREGSQYGWYCCIMVGSVDYG